MIIAALITIGVLAAIWGTFTAVVVSRQHIRQSRESGGAMTLFNFDPGAPATVDHGCHVSHSHIDCGGHH